MSACVRACVRVCVCVRVCECDARLGRVCMAKRVRGVERTGKVRARRLEGGAIRGRGEERRRAC